MAVKLADAPSNAWPYPFVILLLNVKHVRHVVDPFCFGVVGRSSGHPGPTVFVSGAQEFMTGSAPFEAPYPMQIYAKVPVK